MVTTKNESDGRIMTSRRSVQSPLTCLLQNAACVPTITEITTIRQKVELLICKLRSLNDTFSCISTPSRDVLTTLRPDEKTFAELVQATRAMRYPIELVRWVNDCRLLASRAAGQYRSFLAELDKFDYCLSAAEEQFHWCNSIKQRLASIIMSLELLLQHLDDHLFRQNDIVPPQKQSSFQDAYILS